MSDNQNDDIRRAEMEKILREGYDRLNPKPKPLPTDELIKVLYRFVFAIGMFTCAVIALVYTTIWYLNTGHQMVGDFIAELPEPTKTILLIVVTFLGSIGFFTLTIWPEVVRQATKHYWENHKDE